MKTLKMQKIHPEAKVPTYANPGDAGMDLYATEKVIIKPGKMGEIATGIAIELPRGTVGLLWEKSGLAFRHGIKTLGGVIDEGYRGEVKVGLINLGPKAVVIGIGDKVAQLLVQEVHQPRIRVTKTLSSSHRGTKGFGSSGK